MSICPVTGQTSAGHPETTSSSLDAPLSYPLERPGPLEPPAEWETLRQECPVAPITFPSGDPAVLLTRYDDVRQVLSDPRFSRVGEGSAKITNSETGGVFNRSTASPLPQTGEGHQQWRRMLSKWFTAKRMAALKPAIAAMADRLIDDMIKNGPNQDDSRTDPGNSVDPGDAVDLKAALGFPLPVWVICMLLGVPDSDRDRFSHWSDAFLNLDRFTDDEVATARQEFHTYLLGHVRSKRADPGDDVLGTMITDARAAGTELSDEMLVATGLGLLVAGHETTANMIGKMTAMLLSDRTRWEQLVADPSMIRTAVEEVLRMDTNLGFGMPRYLTEEVELSAAAVPANTTVICDMSAANRDQQIFTDGDTMDLTRSPNPHLTFGAGPHSCLGQMLARTELQTVLEVMVRRLPSLELAVPTDQLQPITGLIVGGLQTVPVRW
ncbi:cytochrome P450 [Microlunatus soli]|uniref:Cytochrome P450 n=1 Tax=Microlunatus soli TaxID=630515 RepID=A0A1H1XT62_9ACTN|nr:cytochrome P450 [Microlunatus soli]SDT11936.1 Cytochrome P450 [Microlunatus soli]